MNANDKTVIIVGAGLAGICAACYLSKNAIPFVVLEKSGQVGGIWSALDWPGIRCDTEILNYSYSFNPFLSQRNLVPGAEISAYLSATVKKFGISSKIRFDTRVITASYSSLDHCWRLQTTNGKYTSRFLINTNGYFEDRPYLPEFIDQDRYTGDIRHLFEIDNEQNLSDKSVVLVGSGASAISAAPALTARCGKLTLLQRSPSYIYEQDNRIGRFTDLAQRLYGNNIHWPVKLVNWLQQCKSDLVFVSFRKMPRLGRWFFRRHWHDAVDDAYYREHLQPSYNPWQQRIPVGLGFKQLLASPRFEWITGRIARFETGAALLEDGRRIEADSFLFATGFNLKFFRFALTVDGKNVDTQDINFYKSMMMGGLPNYFQPFGPPHTSFTRRVETICSLVVKIIQYMEKQGFESVSIARRPVEKHPRITPGYIMRKLDELPAMHGTLELPSIDNLLFYRFRPGDYRFSSQLETCSRASTAARNHGWS